VCQRKHQGEGETGRRGSNFSKDRLKRPEGFTATFTGKRGGWGELKGEEGVGSTCSFRRGVPHDRAARR